LKRGELKEPAVLVRRKQTRLYGPNRDELVYLPGLPVISLFTGAGGMDIGCEAAGLCVVLQHEWEEVACQTLIANRPTYFRHAALIQGDIRNTPTGMLLRESGLRVGECGVVIGGPPCQGYSTSGKRQPDDPRNSLVFEFLRAVRDAKPHFFIFENVPGFITLSQGDFMRRFLKEAHDAYYELVYGLVDCAEYGVPQRRVRFVCTGTRRDLVECEGVMASLPEPTHFAPADLAVMEAIKASMLFPQIEIQRFTHAPGIRYFPDRPVLSPPSPTFDGSRSSGYLEFYDRLEREEPDRIVRAPQSAE
jgi:DNA-cytosine methyltransferase